MTLVKLGARRSGKTLTEEEANLWCCCAVHCSLTRLLIIVSAELLLKTKVLLMQADVGQLSV